MVQQIVLLITDFNVLKMVQDIFLDRFKADHRNHKEGAKHEKILLLVIGGHMCHCLNSGGYSNLKTGYD